MERGAGGGAGERTLEQAFEQCVSGGRDQAGNVAARLARAGLSPGEAEAAGERGSQRAPAAALQRGAPEEEGTARQWAAARASADDPAREKIRTFS